MNTCVPRAPSRPHVCYVLIVDQVERVLSQVSTGVTSGTSDLKNSITGKVKNYLNSLDRPELNYEGLENDMET